MNPFDVDHSGRKDRNRHRAFAKIVVRRFQHARVFNRGNPDRAITGLSREQVLHHRVGGFGGAARPDQIQRVTAKDLRERFPRCFDRTVGALADAMKAGGVADELVGGVEPGFLRDRQHR